MIIGCLAWMFDKEFYQDEDGWHYTENADKRLVDEFEQWKKLSQKNFLQVEIAADTYIQNIIRYGLKSK